MQKAGTCSIENDMNGARQAYTKAIKINPEDPSAHHNLATVYSNSGHYVGAAKEYIKSVFLIEINGLMYEPYMEIWARSIASTHALFRDRGGALTGLSKPIFLTDDERMLACAKQASELVPTYNETWAMLALLAE